MKHESPTAIAKNTIIGRYSFIIPSISTLFCAKFQGYLELMKKIMETYCSKALYRIHYLVFVSVLGFSNGAGATSLFFLGLTNAANAFTACNAFPAKVFEIGVFVSRV